MNGGDLSIATPNDFDNLKAEIIREIRNEISKAKQEIIEGTDSLKNYTQLAFYSTLSSFFSILYFAAIKTEFIRR